MRTILFHLVVLFLCLFSDFPATAKERPEIELDRHGYVMLDASHVQNLTGRGILPYLSGRRSGFTRITPIHYLNVTEWTTKVFFSINSYISKFKGVDSPDDLGVKVHLEGATGIMGVS